MSTDAGTIEYCKDAVFPLPEKVLPLYPKNLPDSNAGSFF